MSGANISPLASASSVSVTSLDPLVNVLQLLLRSNNAILEALRAGLPGHPLRMSDEDVDRLAAAIVRLRGIV